MKIRTLFLTALFSALIFSSCGKDDDNSVSPEIKIEASTLTLTTSEICTATARFTTNMPWTITLGDPAPTWFTMDKLSGEAGQHALTITVKEANPSYTDQRKGVITIKVGDKTGTITVIQPARSAVPVAVIGVTLNKAATSLLVDATETLTAIINPTNATNQNVTWSSSDATVATVSNSGVVTAKTVGTATITVTTADGNKTATCTVTVNPIVVTGVSLDKTSATLVRAKTEALTATVNPTNATNKAVTWTSTDAGIVSVDAKGNVTAVKVGAAIITVVTTDGAKTADCTITVIDPANPGGITADSWGNETGGSLNTH